MKRYFSTFYLLLSTCYLLVPLVSFAHTPSLWPTGYWGAPLLSCSSDPIRNAGLPPCTSLCDILHTSQHVIYFGITLALFAIAPVLLIWGGLMILIAGPSPERLGTGKKILTGTIIGVAVVLGSFLIINTFLWALNAFTDPTGQEGIAWPTIECVLPPS